MILTFDSKFVSRIPPGTAGNGFSIKVDAVDESGIIKHSQNAFQCEEGASWNSFLYMTYYYMKARGYRFKREVGDERTRGVEVV